jgi:hypothetical protein
MLFIRLRLGLPSGLFPSGFPTNNLYTFLFSPIRGTCLAHLILLDSIILIILGAEYSQFYCSALPRIIHRRITVLYYFPRLCEQNMEQNGRSAPEKGAVAVPLQTPETVCPASTSHSPASLATGHGSPALND